MKSGHWHFRFSSFPFFLWLASATFDGYIQIWKEHLYLQDISMMKLSSPVEDHPKTNCFVFWDFVLFWDCIFGFGIWFWIPGGRFRFFGFGTKPIPLRELFVDFLNSDIKKLSKRKQQKLLFSFSNSWRKIWPNLMVSFLRV